jgi:aminoglycoside phosphotransferase (APT) family kinase protein
LKARLFSILADLKDGNSLCHFDYHPDQVLISTNGLVVLDWITAIQGNPAADVARSMVLLRFGQAPHLNWITRQAVNMFRRIFARTYLKTYLDLHQEIDSAEIRKWMVVIAAARLKEGIKEEERAILRYIKRELVRNEGA